MLKNVVVVVVVLLVSSPCDAALEDNLVEEGRGLLGAVLDAWGPCPEGAGSLPCQGLQVARRVAKALDGAAPIGLADGVSLVHVAVDPGTVEEEDGGAAAPRASGLASGVARFLQSRELRVSLPQLIGADAWGRFLNSTLVSGNGNEMVESRKNKGGGGGLGYAMAGMMMWMMGSMALGGLGLMALKALALSAMAMLLAAVAAVKKLASGHDDGGGHHVSVVPVHGGHDYHRKRRDAEQDDALSVAYRAYLARNKK